MGYVVIKDENLLKLVSIKWARKQPGGDGYRCLFFSGLKSSMMIMMIIFTGLKSSMMIMMIMIVVMKNKNLFKLVSIKWARKQHISLLKNVADTTFKFIALVVAAQHICSL